MEYLTDFLITTSQDPAPAIYTLAQDLAKQTGAPFIIRGRQSLALLRETYQMDQILVFTQKGPIIHTPMGQYFFHLSMADLRIKGLIIGKHDHMTNAMQLTPGISVLDCTLGLATDAIVASFVTGVGGRITGLESASLIAIVARLGLADFTHSSSDITAALRRIEVIQADYYQYLPSLPDNSYDIVYFDPMFRHPINSSSSLKSIRTIADNRPLSLEIIEQAYRVANKRVVLKEKSSSSEFHRLGFAKLVGGKHSSIQYGVMEVNKCNAS